MSSRLAPQLLVLALSLIALGAAAPAAAQEPTDTSVPAAEHSADDSVAPEPPTEKTLLGRFNDAVSDVLFFDVTGGRVQVAKVDRQGAPVLDEAGQQVMEPVRFPFLVLVLVLGAIFFTFWYRFINLRGFRHAIEVVRGKYDDPDDEGEITHFRALTSALSATVGLGNIAGVAIAIVQGGPGAVVWMMIAAVFGMTAKFSSCTLAQLHRRVNPDGSISGGPMYYLDLGLKELGPAWGKLGKVLAAVYAVMIMGGSLGAGNMFQANQTVEALRGGFQLGPSWSWAIGIIMAVMVGAVILGGIKRIGAATSKIVPIMVGMYVTASLLVVLINIQRLPESVALMFKLAFSENAFFGGMMGVLVVGVQRAAFSNEAGLGSAAVAHAAAKTDEPVREGLVATLEPFIDTIIVCFMTATVVIVTGKWSDPALVDAPTLKGAAVTAAAFETVIGWFPYVLAVCIALFAYSTMISWCYYGERGWIYLLDHFGGSGLKSVFVFRIIFVLAVIVGATNKLDDVLAFSDFMVLSMAFPNIVGSVILAPRVLERVQDYWSRYTSGKMKTYAELLEERGQRDDRPEASKA